MDKKNPDRENPWANARIKPANSDARKPRAAAAYSDHARRDPPAPRSVAPSKSDAAPPRPAPPESKPRATHEAPVSAPVQRRGAEIRVYGRNACLAAFAKRSQDLRKVYLTEARIADFKPVLAWCVKQRLGYRVVENEDLDRLTEAQHHEGVCFELRRQAPLRVAELVSGCGAGPALLVWLDGVGNPHNVGAILRSAANFGVRGMILPAGAPLLSGAALRVAEGGAEAVPLAQAQAHEDIATALHAAGFKVAACVPHDGAALYKSELPPRLALVLGAEGEGMSNELIRRADLRLTVPGTGAVESLNVAASAAVLFAEFWRRHQA